MNKEDSLYSIYVQILKEELEGNIIVISIVCDKNIRYSRLKKREIRPLTKKEAINRDIAEIENVAKAPPIAYADYYILNNGTMEEYETRLSEILKKI